MTGGCGVSISGLADIEQGDLAKRIINGKPDQWVRRHVTDWEIVNE